MKDQRKKWLSYLLGAVVLLIWGIVIHRLIKGLFSDDEGMVMRTPSDPVDSTSVERAADTFSLKLDYPDPFLKDAPRRRRARRVRDQKEEEKGSKDQKKDNEDKNGEEKEQLRWPQLEFGGIVRNRSSDRVVALLRIDGKDRLMKEGDEHEKVSLEEVWSDSVRVALNGKERVIAK